MLITSTNGHLAISDQMRAFEVNLILNVSTHFQKWDYEKISHGAFSSVGWYSFDPHSITEDSSTPPIFHRGSSNGKHTCGPSMTMGGFGGPKPGFCVYTDRISSYDLGGSAHADGRACLTSKLQDFGLPEHRSSLLGPWSWCWLS